MRLTRETEYALKGLLALARRGPGAQVSLADLAAAEDLPASFLAKIFQKLVRHGLLESSRGPGAGYSLAAEPAQVSVLEVIEAVQGSSYFDQCLFWGGRCGGSNPCLLHCRWTAIKPQVKAMLEDTMLVDLASPDGAPKPCDESEAVAALRTGGS